MERVAIFIDGSNFYHGLKGNRVSTKIDFLKFGKLLCKGRKLVRIYYYNAPISQEDDPKRYKDQRRFFQGLKNTDYFELKLGRLAPRGRAFVEKGVDIKIAVDMLTNASRNFIDTAILVSGDADFACAIQAVKDVGKHTEVAYFKKGLANELKSVADKFILLNRKFLNKCLIK